jgi:GntR family transcriptional repressor for pyruvate dehydrogenase complex
MVQRIIDLANWQHVEADAGTPEYTTATHRGLRAHHRVVDLIEAGAPGEATALWRKHLAEARDYLLQADVKTVLDLMD